MIKVENLTKRYAGHTAIKDLTFEVGNGEIMGFLGPNGAGKTTTMRILASFMPPTSGRVSIAGYDIFRQSLQARSRDPSSDSQAAWKQASSLRPTHVAPTHNEPASRRDEKQF